MRNDRQNLIVDLTFKFALDIIAYSEEIKAAKKFEMSSQIFRSGLQLVLIRVRLKMRKASRTSSISLKLQQKKPMKLIIG